MLYPEPQVFLIFTPQRASFGNHPQPAAMLNRLVRILSPEKRAASPATSSPTASPPAAASTLSGGHTANFENSRTSMNLESEQPPATTLPIPHETWFRLLQDVGKEMTPAEFAKFTEND